MIKAPVFFYAEIVKSLFSWNCITGWLNNIGQFRLRLIVLFV